MKKKHKCPNPTEHNRIVHCDAGTIRCGECGDLVPWGPAVDVIATQLEQRAADIAIRVHLDGEAPIKILSAVELGGWSFGEDDSGNRSRRVGALAREIWSHVFLGREPIADSDNEAA